MSHILQRAIFICLFLVMGTPSVSAKLLDKIVALVGDAPITLSDLQAFRKDIEKQNVMRASGQLDIKAMKDDKAVLDLLIRDKLLEQAIKRMDLKASEEEIEVMIGRIQKQNNLTRVQLRDALESQGISYEIFRDNIRKQIEKQNIIQKEIQQKVQITEQDIYNYYLNTAGKNSEKGFEVRVSHILITAKNAGSRDKAQERALNVIKRLNEGMVWEAAVKDFSEDVSTVKVAGDLGFFKKGALDPKFEQALEPLKVGDIAPPVMIGNSVHVVKLVDRRFLDNEDFLSKKEQIRNVLQKAEFDRQIELWFAVQRDEAHVKSHL